MAIINNAASVSNLPLEQLAGIFSGEYTNWNQVGGNDKEITVVSRESESGTRDGFEEALKEVDPDYSLSEEAVENTSPPTP